MVILWIIELVALYINISSIVYVISILYTVDTPQSHLQGTTSHGQGSGSPTDSARWLVRPQQSPQGWPNPGSSAPWGSQWWKPAWKHNSGREKFMEINEKSDLD